MAAHYRVVTGVRDSARGWNADQFGRRPLPAPSTARSVSGCGTGSGWAGGVGTLLGPEGAGPARTECPGGGRELVCRGRPGPRTTRRRRARGAGGGGVGGGGAGRWPVGR